MPRIGFRTPALPPDTKGLPSRTAGQLHGILWVCTCLIRESDSEENALQGIRDFKRKLAEKAGRAKPRYQQGVLDVLNGLEQFLADPHVE